jgi:hypothetical protein
MFGKTWGPKPKVIYWIHTAAVRPIVTYAVIVWWPKVKLKTSQAKDGLFGNYRSNENSSNSCNWSLPWTPHYTCRWKRRKPKSKGFGHAYLTQDMKEEPIQQMGPDKMIPRHVYDKPFMIIFPDRSQWKEGFQPDRKGGLIWYTDGSKTNKGTGAGVYCYGTRRKLSFSLG